MGVLLMLKLSVVNDWMVGMVVVMVMGMIEVNVE